MLENSDYNENIMHLRAERIEARAQFEKITNCITETMSILNGKSDKSMVTIEDFRAVPMNEVVDLTSKVSFIKTFENENEMHFKTYLKAGGKYGVHAHDCDEHTTVVKGHLIELLNERKTYNEGETVTYLANSLHEPSCEIDSEYHVIFKM
jgi:quercetin dioxygenase-like cupin family protein